MGAAKKLEVYPDEQFLADAIKDGRATRQEVSMKALGKPDVRLQAREQHLDMDHVRMLAEILEREGQLAPVVIFRTKEGKLLLADGFHRHEVYRKAGNPGIPAWVIDGDFREAIEYATMCNRRLCLARKPGDIRKAIEILLADDVWFRRVDKWISEHIGCSPSTVASVRDTYCRTNAIDLPNELVRRGGGPWKRKTQYARVNRIISNGKIRFTVHVGSKYVGSSDDYEKAKAIRDGIASVPIKPILRCYTRKGRATLEYRANILGSDHYLGSSKEAAQAKLDQLWAEHLKSQTTLPATTPNPTPCCPHCGHSLPGWSAPK